MFRLKGRLVRLSQVSQIGDLHIDKYIFSETIILGSFVLWRFLYCGDFCTVEIFVLWRFLYCGDFCTVGIFVLGDF